MRDGIAENGRHGKTDDDPFGRVVPDPVVGEGRLRPVGDDDRRLPVLVDCVSRHDRRGKGPLDHQRGIVIGQFAGLDSGRRGLAGDPGFRLADTDELEEILLFLDVCKTDSRPALHPFGRSEMDQMLAVPLGLKPSLDHKGVPAGEDLGPRLDRQDRLVPNDHLIFNDIRTRPRIPGCIGLDRPRDRRRPRRDGHSGDGLRSFAFIPRAIHGCHLIIGLHTVFRNRIPVFVEFGFNDLLVAGKGRHTPVEAVPGQIGGCRFLPGEQNQFVPADGPEPCRLLRRRSVERARSQRIDPFGHVSGIVRQTTGDQCARDIIPRDDPVNAEVETRILFLLLHIDPLLEFPDRERRPHFRRPLHDDADFIPRLFRNVLRILDEKGDGRGPEHGGQRRRRDRLDHLPEKVVAGAQKLDVTHVHRGRDHRGDDADRGRGKASLMDPDDVLSAPEELARLRLVHLHLRPDRDLRIDHRKELVKIGDLPVDDGIHPEDLSQFLGGGFLDLFGIRQVRFCQQVVDLRDLHVPEGKGAEVVVETPAYGFRPLLALGPVEEGKNRHR